MKQTFKLLTLLLLLLGTGTHGFAQSMTAPTEGDQYFYWPAEQAQGFSGNYGLQVELFSKNGNQLVQTFNIPSWDKNYLYVPKSFVYGGTNCKLKVASLNQGGNAIQSQEIISQEIGDDDGWVVQGQWHCTNTWSTIQLFHQIGTNYTYHLEVGDIQKVVYMTNSEKNNFVATLPSYFVEGVHYWVSEIDASIEDGYCDRNGYTLSGTIYAVRRKSTVGSWIGSPFNDGVGLPDQNNGFMANKVATQGGPSLGACSDNSCASSDPDEIDTDPFDWDANSEEIWDDIIDCLGHPDDNTGWPCHNDDDNGSILDGFGDFPIETSLNVFEPSLYTGNTLQGTLDEIAIYNLNDGNHLGQKYIYNLASLDQYSQNMQTVLGTSGLQRGVYSLVITAKNGRQFRKTFVKTTGRNAGQKTDWVSAEAPQFKVYPNPGTGVFNLEGIGTEKTQLQVSVVDMMGKTIYQQQTNGLNSMKFDLGNLPAGIYHLAVQGGKVNWTHKLILQ